MQDIEAKISMSIIYDTVTQDNEEQVQYNTSAVFVPNIKILYNSSANKNLMLCYILDTIVSVFAKFCRQKYYLYI